VLRFFKKPAKQVPRLPYPAVPAGSILTRPVQVQTKPTRGRGR
jgi:hypothetical protein